MATMYLSDLRLRRHMEQPMSSKTKAAEMLGLSKNKTVCIAGKTQKDETIFMVMHISLYPVQEEGAQIVYWTSDRPHELRHSSLYRNGGKTFMIFT